jgi:hypothetical protein
MDIILDDFERLIDDIERDDSLTKTEILETLYRLKEEIEQYKLEETNSTIDWEDLDNY